MAALHTIVLVGLILQSPPASDAQGPPPPQSAPPVPLAPEDPSLVRIRARLASPPAVAVPPAPSLFPPLGGRPLFQVHIEEEWYTPWDWLDDGTSIPDYIRPTYPPTHHEFMLMVTPEMFRGVAVHPYGVPVLSIARVASKAIRKQMRQAAQARARKEVEEALAALAEERAKAQGRQATVPRSP